MARALRSAPLALLAALLCSRGSGAPLTRPPQAGQPPRVPATVPQQPLAPARSVLAFRAPMADGGLFDFSAANATRRLVIYVFDPGEPDAAATAAAERLHRERHERDLAVVGLAAPPPRVAVEQAQLAAQAKDCLEKAGATFPCALDPTGTVAEAYSRAATGGRASRTTALFAFPLLAQAGAGYSIQAAAARESPDPSDYLYRGILAVYGMDAVAETDPLAGDHPKAPDVAFLDSTGKTRRLSDYRGQAIVLVFIARECPRCKAELEFLEEMLKAYGSGARREKPQLEVLVVCTDASGPLLKSFVAVRGYTFPVGGDPEWAVRTAYRYQGPVPDAFVIAPDGTVRFRHHSHSRELNDVLHMEIRTLLGLETKPLLGSARYSGDRACRICHAREFADWSLTRHACAWDTLVRMSRQQDTACTRCHVVAFDGLGGFISAESSPHLTGVQCESCHGGNGCKAFTGKPAEPVKAAACQKCHDEMHSPRFDFETARRRVLHNRADELAKLPRAEREKQLRRLCSGMGRELFNPDTPYVGSAACARCHPTASQALQDGFHAKAAQALATAAPAGTASWRAVGRTPPHKRGVVGLRKAECLRCHVTGFGRPGGFPAAVPDDPLQHPMAGVGCEACHGPGKAHGDDPKAPRAIARLGGTCNECNILPICRQCHDGENSPEFDYKDALLRVRHPAGKAVTP